MRIRLFPVLLAIFLALAIYLLVQAFDRWLIPAAVTIARAYYNLMR